MENIKNIKDLSSAIREICDRHTVNLIKLHKEYWKDIDPEDTEQIISISAKLIPLLTEEILDCLEEIVSLTLKILKKLYNIKNKNVLELEDLMYKEDGKTLVDRLVSYYIEHKGQRATYNLIRLINTESRYVFSGVMEDKIDPELYPYFRVDNIDEDDCGCPTPGTIFPMSAQKPPYHPDCECMWEPLTQEEYEKIILN